MRRRRQRLLAAIGLLALVGTTLAVAAAALAVRRGFSTREAPSALEAALARTLRALATPGHVRALAPPRPPTPEERASARLHWASHCASCHAVDGSGQTDVGRRLYPPVPDMRAAATQQLTDGELYAVIKNGVRLTGMPAWGEPGDADLETWALVAFLRTLPRLTDADVVEIRQNLPRTPHEVREELEEDEFLRGASPSSPHQEHAP